MNEWENAKTKHLSKFKELRKLIPGYEYSDSHRAELTDGKLSLLILEELRKCKNTLFDIVEISYELQLDKLTKGVQKIRDELDIFADEIKVRYFEWKSPPEFFLEKIIEHDHGLVKGGEKFRETLDSIRKLIMKMEKPGGSLFDKKQLELLERKTREAEQQLDSLVRLYKERESIFKIKSISIMRTFRKLREEIKSRI